MAIHILRFQSLCNIFVCNVQVYHISRDIAKWRFCVNVRSRSLAASLCRPSVRARYPGMHCTHVNETADSAKAEESLLHHTPKS